MNTAKPIGLLLLLSLIVPAIAFSQTTENYYDYKWKPCKPEKALFYSEVVTTDSGWYRRDYYVRERKLQMAGLYKDQECKIPNGTFYYFYPNTQVSSLGKYADGKKNGLWLTYHPNKMIQDSVFYAAGNPVGISLYWYPSGYIKDSALHRADGSGVSVSWFNNGQLAAAGLLSAGDQKDKKWKYFYKNGQPSCIEIYDRGRLLERTHFDETGKATPDTADIERDATFPGGLEAWQKYLHKKLYFPTQYKFENGTEAVVVVSFSVSEEGVIEDAYVSTSLHPAFDRIALDVVKHSPKWLPAFMKNRNVRQDIRQPITFGQIED